MERNPLGFKPRTAEYGTELFEQNRSVRTVLDQRGDYTLVHKTAGYELAGSCARLTTESYGALNERHRSGQWCNTLDVARSLFEQWSNKP